MSVMFLLESRINNERKSLQYNVYISILTPNAFSSADAFPNAKVLRMLDHKRYMSNLHHLFNNIKIWLIGYKIGCFNLPSVRS